MHVAHVIARLGQEATGPAYTVPAICNALAARGLDVSLHLVDDPPPASEQLPQYRLCVHPGTRALRAIDGSTSMRHQLAADAAHTEVFHSHGLWRMPGLYAAALARRYGKPSVITPRGMLERAALSFSASQKRLFWVAGQGRALACAQCLHATSDTELASIRLLGLRNPVAVVANGVQVPPRHAHFSSARRTLLYLGRLHPIKALDRLIDAWALLERTHPSWNLRLVGPSEGTHQQLLSAQCARLGLSRVSFGPAVFGETKRAEYEAAQLYALPSHSENFGMTLAEAMASGLPVVASHGTPWAELEREGCGLWTENSVPSLAAALGAMMAKSPRELAANGERARAWMERSFSWSHKAEQLQDVYDWLRGRTPSAPDSVELAAPQRLRAANGLGAWIPPW